jgi:hypothetical protein
MRCFYQPSHAHGDGHNLLFHSIILYFFVKLPSYFWNFQLRRLIKLLLKFFLIKLMRQSGANRLHCHIIKYYTLFCKILNQGPLPWKRPRQKDFRAYRYRFLPFYMVKRNHAKMPIRPRRNTDTAATKRNTAATKC